MGSGHTHVAPLAASFIGRLDARAKLITILPAIVLVNAVGPAHWRVVAVVAALLATLLASAGRGALATLKRGALLLPFVGFVAVTLPFAVEGREAFSFGLGPLTFTATCEGLARAGWVAAGAGTSILGALLLSAVTEGPELFKGLRALGVPRAFVAIMAVIYRYLLETAEEFQRLKRSAAARGFEATSVRALPRMGAMAAALLARSVARSESVHHAMLARGFDGEMRTITRTRFGASEAAFVAAFYAAVAAGIVLVTYA